ncbi:hypothetical protein ABDB91_17150 [Desulfoscipio sp. XC116]
MSHGFNNEVADVNQASLAGNTADINVLCEGVGRVIDKLAG